MTQPASAPPRPRARTAVILAIGALITVAAVTLIAHFTQPGGDPTAGMTASNTYLYYLTNPAQTNGDPLYLMAKNNPDQAVAFGNAVCQVMRDDRAAYPDLYSDVQQLFDDVRFKLEPDWDSKHALATPGAPPDPLDAAGPRSVPWDYTDAAAAAAQQGSLCPEFYAEVDKSGS